MKKLKILFLSIACLVSNVSLSGMNETLKNEFALYKACENNDIENVRRHLNSGVAPCYTDGEGWTPLHFAVDHSSPEMINLLLEKNAQIDAQENRGWTPLHLATLNQNTECIETLLKNNACIEAKNNQGFTPLHEAVEENIFQVVQYLIKNNASVTTCTKSRLTPLHSAACKGNSTIAKMLIKSGAEIDAQNTSGRTPLYVASRWNHQNVVNVLLEEGACPDSIDGFGQSAFHIASILGLMNIIKSLMTQSFFPPKHESNIQSLKRLCLASVFKNLDANMVNTLTFLDPWRYDIIADMAPLDKQKALFADWEKQNNKQSKTSQENLIMAHCQRHFLYLQQFLAQKDLKRKTAYDYAYVRNRTEVAKLLKQIAEAKSYFDLSDELKISIHKNIQKIFHGK